MCDAEDAVYIANSSIQRATLVEEADDGGNDDFACPFVVHRNDWEMA